MEIDGSMFGTLDVAVSGLKAHGKQVRVVASNVANARTTDAGDGKPYRRIEAVFEAKGKNGLEGVDIGDLKVADNPFQQVLMPGHPQADENGYVLMPNIDYPMELIKLNVASRAYKANAAMMKRYQSMVNSTLDLLK